MKSARDAVRVSIVQTYREETKMPTNPTKPLAVVKTGEGESEGLVVVCEDGTAYVYNWRDRVWHELSPIPNTPAAAR